MVRKDTFFAFSVSLHVHIINAGVLSYASLGIDRVQFYSLLFVVFLMISLKWFLFEGGRGGVLSPEVGELVTGKSRNNERT